MKPEKTEIAEELAQLFAAAPGAEPATEHAAAASLTYAQQERLYVRASNLYGQSHYEDALKIFWILLRVSPIEARFHQATASCLQMLGLYKEAVNSYGSAWMLDVGNPDPLFYIGQCLLAQGQSAQAREAFDEFIARAKTAAGAALCKRAKSYIAYIDQKA
jgi:type III secretion system low calcium response chaperone LcrH/SycD